MNLDSLSFALSQISYLVDNLSKKNLKQSSQELSNLVSQHGLEADRHLLRCLFSHVDFSVDGNKSSIGNTKDCLQTQLLIQECANLLFKPTLTTLICYAFDNPLHQQKTLKPSPQLFPQIRKVLKLSPVQEVVFGLSLQNSTNAELKKLSFQFVRQKLPELVASYVDAESSRQHEGGLHDTTPEVLQLILSNLKSASVSADIQSVFWKRLQRDFPREHVPVVLAPLIYPACPDLPMDKQQDGGVTSAMLDSSFAGLVPDIGSAFTASVEGCKNLLVNLSGGELTPAAVAQTMTAMLQTPPADSKHPNFFDKGDKSGGEQQWNMEVFVQAVKDIHPNMSWRDVLMELDNPNFTVKDRNSFILLFNGIRLFFDPFSFPVDVFYRRWNNAEGQYSLIAQILKNPETFSFADHRCHQVPVDMLKATPDIENKEVATWKSLDLIETLLGLSERGFYNQVLDLFKFPISTCPDVLMLGLLQHPPPLNVLRQELITLLMPTFFGMHPNTTIIMHHAWNANNLMMSARSIVMSCMSDWYLRSEMDQMRLSRILDIAQDLKALTFILNSQAFPFVIDLACLASRRGYLKLDKWLSDKIREHGEAFISACAKFLQRRCPQLLTGKEDLQSKAPQLPTETLTTVLACLQVCASSVSQELADTIHQMVSNCSILINKSRQPTGVLRQRTLDVAFNQFPSPQTIDPLASLSSSLAGMNIIPNISTSLGSLVPTPGSPSRLAGSSHSPYPLYLNAGLQHPAGGSQLLSSINIGMPRVPAPGVDAKQPSVVTNMFGEAGRPIPQEVEDEANSYFQRIYNHPPHPTLSIEEVLDMLKKFNESTKQRERDVFQCMLKNLFEEYRFFPQYPDKELHVTAQLFGGIIERGLVPSYMALGLALRFVLDALRKPLGSKMYYFGIAALDRFKSKLKDYQKYCEHVASIPHFHEFPPHLVEYIDYGLQSLEPPNRPQGQVLPNHIAAIIQQALPGTTALKTIPTTTVTTTTTVAKVTTASAVPARPSIANATNIDTLLVATEKEDKITPPPEALQDKIGFIFNNLSQLNLQNKSDELRDLIHKEHWPWMAQYMVLKRVTIEFNFHVLYSNFLEVLKIPDLTRLVLRETYRNIRVLLRSDKGIANFSDRSLLKNLGHWLGMLTLARNKPILMIDIDFKSLIIEAFAKGQQELLYVIPFVSKVIESCAKSKIFKPKNPWTMAVMNILAELHREQDLKLNLKFEIEVLCKSLDVDLAKLTPTNLLKDPKRLESLEQQLSKPDDEPVPSQAVVQPPVQSALTKSALQSANEEIQQMAVAPVPNLGSQTTNAGTPTVIEPRFHFMDLNVGNVNNLAQHLSINQQLPIFQAHPQLKALVPVAVEAAVKEWIGPVMDRSIKIATATAENIVRRDFALDPDENRMRPAAHNLVRCLTGSMAMITCRDHMLASIAANLKSSFNSTFHGATKQQMSELVDSAATSIAEANMELACAFIQKAAMEKAVPEIDKRLADAYDLRKLARSEGRRHYDTAMFNYQMERMPEPVRHPIGGVPLQRFNNVYGECGKSIPGFRPISERDYFGNKPSADTLPASTFPNNASLTYPDDEKTALYDKLVNDIELYLQAALTSSSVVSAGNPRIAALHALRETAILARRSRDPASGLALLQKAVEGLLEGMNQRDDPEMLVRYRDAHLRVLKILQDPRIFGAQWTVKQVTRCLLEARDDIRYNFDAFDCLIRSGLVSMPQIDELLAQSIENGPNIPALLFAIQLVQIYLIEDRLSAVLLETDLQHTINTLVAIHSTRDTPPGLGSMLEMLRALHDPTALTDMPSAGPISQIHAGFLQANSRDYEDSLPEKTEYFLREWVSSYTMRNRDETKSFHLLVQQMGYHSLLKTDDLLGKFIRISAQLCIQNCLRAPQDSQSRVKCYHMLDAFARLVYLFARLCIADPSNTTGRLNLINRTLGNVAGLLHCEHENRSSEFNQMPFERLIIMLFTELTQPEPIMESISFQVLTGFCHTLYMIRPAKVPKFAYAWLELISHRTFLTRIMAATSQQRGWPLYAQLLTSLFKFLAPFLRNTDLPKSINVLYRGTLRVLLVLLHDFPEFLCDYHYGFCDVIPSNCIQMRNLILSAFPRNMRLPDPFTPNLKVDILQEISSPPHVVADVANNITPPAFRKDLDSYLKQRSPVTFLSDLRSNLQITNESGLHYNTQVMNALVLYVGTEAIRHIRNKGLNPNMSTIASSAHMDIFQNLGVDLDTEGRYLFLNAIANQLRYPNSHTHYFSCLLLSLFAESNTESIQEQITRVLLERLIVNRPHPWGLLITFIELIKNPSYKFWSHEFVHCAPEIEKLFESVARSCMVSKQGSQHNDNDVGEALAV